MTGDELLLGTEEKMEASLHAFQERCKGVRTGRASPELVENLKVDCYGSSMSLKQVASIQVPEGTMILVKPFDPSLLKEIEHAVTAANLGITPQADGKILRLPIPPLSQERRRQYADLVKTQAEEARVSLRNLRRDAKKAVDQGKKDGDYPEDDAERLHTEIQNLTDQYGGKVDALLAKKTEEILKG